MLDLGLCIYWSLKLSEVKRMFRLTQYIFCIFLTPNFNVHTHLRWFWIFIFQMLRNNMVERTLANETMKAYVFYLEFVTYSCEGHSKCTKLLIITALSTLQKQLSCTVHLWDDCKSKLYNVCACILRIEINFIKEI